METVYGRRKEGIYHYVKIRPLMDGNTNKVKYKLFKIVKIRPLMDGNLLSFL